MNGLIAFLDEIYDAYNAGSEGIRPARRLLDAEEWRSIKELGVHPPVIMAWDVPLFSINGENAVGRTWLLCRAQAQPPAEGTIRIQLSIGNPSEYLAGTDFSALTAQWRTSASPPGLYSFNSYEMFPDPDSDGGSRITRVVKVERGVHVSADTILIQHQMFVDATTAEAAKDTGQQKRLLKTTLLKSVSDLQELDQLYLPVRAAMKDSWKQLFLLQIHHASLRLFARVVDRLMQRQSELQAEVDPRSAELRHWNLFEMTKDSYQYRNLSEVSLHLTATIESLIGIIRAASPANENREFQVLEAELHGCCREVKDRLDRLSKGLDDQVRFLDLARNINQARGIQQLTLLTAIFLPLSLAAGVLSMQSRFKDLGRLLYDFFGVVVLLAAIVFILLRLMSFLSSVNEGHNRLKSKNRFYRETLKPILAILVSITVAIYGCLVLSSFIVGMFLDVDQGARILGYATAAAALSSVLMVPVLLVLACCLSPLFGIKIGPGLISTFAFVYGLLVSKKRATRKRKKRRHVEDGAPGTDPPTDSGQDGEVDENDGMHAPSETAEAAAVSVTPSVGVTMSADVKTSSALTLAVLGSSEPNQVALTSGTSSASAEVSEEAPTP
ncbi:hypothetical protein MFIFM68171_03074 [Madurella fahalii]|uniref:Uncharacterized protein n=1 Tax=Madurella fahalii TaxID=1157608 RepID=A0ABQ0G562_9PEZI